MMVLGEISLLTSDVIRLANFYKALLGVDNHSDDPVHQFIVNEPVSLTVYNAGTEQTNQNQNTCLAFTTDDIKQAFAAVKALGAEIIEPPTLRPWGAVNMSFYDPDHNTVYLRQFPK